MASRGARRVNHIDSLLELFSHLKEWELLWGHRDLLSRLWVTPLVGTVLLNHEATEASDLYATATHERVSHFAIYEVYHLFRLNDVDL